MSSQELIFISYRRSDSLAATGRVYDHVVKSFGENNVFRDTNSIYPGVNFDHRLKHALSVCHVTIVIIGSTWLTATAEDGSRRLDDPDDYVRTEVESSLNRGTEIIPVLLDGTKMPKPSDLPATMRKLAFQNAAFIEQGHLFEQHMKRLIEAIWEQILKRRRAFIKSRNHSHHFSYYEYVYKDRSIWLRFLRSLLKREILKIKEIEDIAIEQTTWHLGSEEEVLELIKVPSSKYIAHRASSANVLKSRIRQDESVGSFFIGKYPISQRQWKLISVFSDGKLNDDPSRFKGDNRPVESITWDEANTYCQVLSRLTKRTFRLPVKAEWQHACRAGSTGFSPYGLGHDRVNIISAEKAYQRSDGASTHEMFNHSGMSESYWPNLFGLYHMLGNVSEWCNDDWYIGDRSQLSTTQADRCTDRKIACGGSFIHPRRALCSETLDGEDSTLRLEYVGFRIVMEASK